VGAIDRTHTGFHRRNDLGTEGMDVGDAESYWSVAKHYHLPHAPSWEAH